MDAPFYGAALFSTHLGRYEARTIFPTPVILRSDPDGDQDHMVAKLQEMFPEQCKVITEPITNIYHYFDPNDTHRHGYLFLLSVLRTIASHNFIRGQKVQNFAEQWMRTNPALFDGIMSATQSVFNDAEFNTYGWPFLGEAFSVLQSLRMSVLTQNRIITSTTYAPRPHSGPSAPPVPASDQRFGANHRRQRPREYSPLSQTHLYGSPTQVSTSHTVLRLNSNKRERSHQRQQYEPLRQPGQMPFPARRDFHSNPQENLRSAKRYSTGSIITVPPSGQPGPFSYQSLSAHYPVTPWVPRPYDPMIAQNPVKMMSDDARVLEFQEAAGRKVNNGSNNLEASLPRSSESSSHGRLSVSEYHMAPRSSASSHSSHQQPASELLEKDPAVISVGFKTDHATNYDHVLLREGHQCARQENEGSLMALIKNRLSPKQQKYPAGVSHITNHDSLAESYHAIAQTKSPNGNKVKLNDAADSSSHRTDCQGKETDSNEPESVSQEVTSEMPDYSSINSNPPHESSEIANVGQLSQKPNYHRRQPMTGCSEAIDTVWVGGLYPEMDQVQLTQLMESCGEVKMISRIFTRDCETPRAFAFVTFVTPQAAAQAVKNLDYVKHDGTVLRVRYTNKYYNAAHRGPPNGKKKGHHRQYNEVESEEICLSAEHKGWKASSLSSSRHHGDHSKSFSSKKKSYQSKSNRRDDITPEEIYFASGSSSSQCHKPSITDTQNESGASDSLGKSVRAENASMAEKGADFSTCPSESVKSPENTTLIEQGLNRATFSQRETFELELGSQAVGDPSAPDLIIKDHSLPLPMEKSQNDRIPVMEPRANQINLVSSTSQALLGTPDLQRLSDTENSRLSDETRWRPERQTTNTAKQKELSLQNEQVIVKAVPSEVDVPSQMKGKSFVSDTNKDSKLVIGFVTSEANFGNIVKQQTQTETDSPSKNQLMGVSQTSYVGYIIGETQLSRSTDLEAARDSLRMDPSSTCRTDGLVSSPISESSAISQTHVTFAAKAVVEEESKVLPMGVDDVLILNSPTWPDQMKNGGAEKISSLQTAVVTHKKKRKVITPVKNNISRACDTPQSSHSPMGVEMTQKVDQDDAEKGMSPETKCEKDLTQGAGKRISNLETTMDPANWTHESTSSHPADSSNFFETTSQKPVSVASRPRKTKGKKVHKSKGKGKAKPVQTSSKSPAEPPEVVERAASSYARYLPAPETPFIVENTDIAQPFEMDEKEKGYEDSESSPTSQGSSTFDEVELTRNYPVEVKEYWKAFSNIFGASPVDDPNQTMISSLEANQDVGDYSESHSPSTVLGDAQMPDLGEDNCGLGTSNTVDDPFLTPEAVARAKQILQTCAELAHPRSKTVTKPKTHVLENASQYRTSTADATESAVPDQKTFAPQSQCSSPSSADDNALTPSHSSPDSCIHPVTINSNGSTKTPQQCPPRHGWRLKGRDGSFDHSGSGSRPQTSQAPCIHACTDSSSSLRTLTIDQSSESSSVQSEDDVTEKEEDYQLVVEAKGSLSTSSQLPLLSFYPSHPTGTPMQTEGTQLQGGDVVELASTDNGDKEVVKVTRDPQVLTLTDRDGVERDYVERRDYSVVRQEEIWGYAAKVWSG